SPEANYWVVETDYDTYSLVYSCTDLEGFARAEIYWILARETSLPEATVNKLKQVLTAKELEYGKFTPNTHKDCPWKDGSKDVATGDAEAMDPNVPAKLSVTFNGSPRVPYWIVDTDYDTYSLVWSCTDIGGLLQADFAWILSRNNTLDNAIIEKLQNKLATFNINTKSFRQTDQSNCDY
ncbi:APOD-like protein, partial [Mya arenaria]